MFLRLLLKLPLNVGTLDAENYKRPTSNWYQVLFNHLPKVKPKSMVFIGGEFVWGIGNLGNFY